MENNNKVFIIAELSANHNHDFDLAKRTIKAMAESGADAVKVQTYTPDSLVMDCDNDHSENPDEWITTSDVEEMFADVDFAIVPRDNTVKNGRMREDFLICKRPKGTALEHRCIKKALLSC